MGVPNVTVHAKLHAIVDAQIALGDETPAHRSARRLLDAGLDRHETIHAIAWVLIESKILRAKRGNILNGKPNTTKIATNDLSDASGSRRRDISLTSAETSQSLSGEKALPSIPYPLAVFARGRRKTRCQLFKYERASERPKAVAPRKSSRRSRPDRPMTPENHLEALPRRFRATGPPACRESDKPAAQQI
jgi:hypothetical protein